MTDTNDTVQFDPAKIAKLPQWRAVDYLKTDADIIGYLSAAMTLDDDLTAEQECVYLGGVVQDVIAALKKRTA